MTYTEYSDRKGQIVSGIVQKADWNGLVVIDLGKLEGYMPEKEQIPTENICCKSKHKRICNECRKRSKRKSTCNFF